ncbi:MAG: radical SAM protein [Deltaproteobacteria bacterium]|nr:radical SAM protein [Deltaproteobacteria bacterium]
MPVIKGYEFFIQWHLTERCNLRCAHCYQEAAPRGRELSFPEILAVIEESAAMLSGWRDAYGIDFSPSFHVTGGEPLLHPELPAILEQMKKRHFAVYLLSNGTLITKPWAERLAALGVDGVQISLEGPAPIHEDIRGPGSFAAALAGAENLLAAGVRVTFNTTLSRLNAAAFLELVPLSKSLGVQELGFARLVPSGRGEALLDQMLSAEDFAAFCRQIYALEVKDLDVGSGDPLANQMDAAAASDSAEDDTFPWGGCAAGVTGLTLLPDGTVLPCRRLPVPLGNVRQDRLREIWAASPVLEALRDKTRYRGKCGSCPRWAQCRGCRAIAYAWSRAQGNPDYLAPDPQCSHNP